MASKKLPQPKNIMLREYEIKRDADDKIISITGKCAEKLANKQYCTNVRTIAPQDAFQVSRCKMCQRRLQHRKIAAKRKARRNAINKAKKASLRAAQTAKLTPSRGIRTAQTANLRTTRR